jgi:hypothetical protein
MNPTVEHSIDTLQAMQRQEELGYSVVDYLSCLPKNNTALDAPVDASCRSIMAKWCNEIADFCNYKRETVAIAVNCLDRFMSTQSGQEILFDRNQYQLAAMTALYSSVKIHEQEAMDPSLVSTLSRGVHSPQAVEAMESKMLNAIKWRVNPPTAMSFVRSMINLLPDHLMLSCDNETVLEVAKFQIELIVPEYDFCTYNASEIAFACALNALESVTNDGLVHADFGATIEKTIKNDDSSIKDLRIAIYEFMNGSDHTNAVKLTTNNITKKASSCAKSVAMEGSDIHLSPRTVATSVAQR